MFPGPELTERSLPDEYTPLQRAEDQDWVWKASRLFGKWNWLVAIIAMLAAAGFIKLWTPADTVRDVQIQIAQVNARVDTLSIRYDAGLTDRRDQRLILEFLGRARCSEMTTAQKEQTGGSDVCDAVTHPLDHAIKTRIRAPGESY